MTDTAIPSKSADLAETLFLIDYAEVPAMYARTTFCTKIVRKSLRRRILSKPNDGNSIFLLSEAPWGQFWSPWGVSGPSWTLFLLPRSLRGAPRSLQGVSRASPGEPFYTPDGTRGDRDGADGAPGRPPRGALGLGRSDFSKNLENPHLRPPLTLAL